MTSPSAIMNNPSPFQSDAVNSSQSSSSSSTNSTTGLEQLTLGSEHFYHVAHNAAAGAGPSRSNVTFRDGGSAHAGQLSPAIDADSDGPSDHARRHWDINNSDTNDLG